MKKYAILFSTLLLTAMLVLSGCGSKDKDDDSITGIPDIDSDTFDWAIYVVDMTDDMREDVYFVNCDWLGNQNAITQDDEFTIKFNDGIAIPIEAWNWGGDWTLSCSADLNPGSSYNVKLFKNGSQQASGNIKTPYRAFATFPSSYNPSATAEINWTLSNNNQYQIIAVSSYGEGFDEDDDEQIDLSPSARNYTVPANIVQNYGVDTEYNLQLLQYNFTKNGRAAFLVVQGQDNSYGLTPTKEASSSRGINYLRQLRKNL